MKTIKLILAVIALGVVSCKKEDPRLANGYFDIKAESKVEVTNYYSSSTGVTTLVKGERLQIGYLASDYMWVRCKTSNCVFYVNNSMYTKDTKFTPPTK